MYKFKLFIHCLPILFEVWPFLDVHKLINLTKNPYEFDVISI
jgi:hypothetical protein